MCKVPLSLSTFLSLSDVLQFIKIWTPRTTSCSGRHAALFSLISYLVVNSPFDPSIHLGVSDVQADTLEDPTCFQIHIKCLKMDPFHVGCNITLVEAVTSSAQWWLWAVFWAICSPFPWPLFCFADGHPLTRQLLSSTAQSIPRLMG